MTNYKYYKSGIYSADFYFEDNGDIFLSELDVFTNTFGPKIPLKDSPNLGEYLNVVGFQDILEKDSITFSKDYNIGELVYTTTGSIYSKLNEYTYVERGRPFPQDLTVVNHIIVGYIEPALENCNVFIQDGYQKYTPLDIWTINMPDEKIYAVEFKGKSMVKMKDGVELATNVYLPKDINEKIPTILIRTPYGKNRGIKEYYKYVQRGYALVVQDVRGKEESQGEWDPLYYEEEDGDDTLNWVVSNSWSDQKVGMLGASYLGYVQWAAAASKNPYLKAIVSIVTSGSPFVDIPRRGGSLLSSLMPWVFSISKQYFDPALGVRKDWNEILNIKPVKDIPFRALGYNIPFYDKWIEHKNYDEYWEKMNWYSKRKNINVPAMVMSGWFDDDQWGSLEAIDVIHSYNSEDRKVILGPWMHSINITRDLDILGPPINPGATSSYDNQMHLGDKSIRYDLDYYVTAWFDNKLKLIQNNIDKGSPVEYFSIGDYSWKKADNWPIKNIDYKIFYLDNGNCLKDGFLKEEPINNTCYYSFLYNPRDPAVQLVDWTTEDTQGPANYKDVEKRSDVLTYTSDVLTKDITLTGNIELNLFAGSSAVDTDWVIRITEVDEKGNSIELTEGLLSARYRNSFIKPEYMCCKKVYKFTIKTSTVSYVFKKGNRIRLTLTSSANYDIFPNNNNCNAFNGVEYVIANNTVYYGKKYPSYIVLPIENKKN